MSLRLWRLLWPFASRLRRGLEKGCLFPDFELRDVRGRAHSLRPGLPGRRTVLWFTNLCEDCRERITLLEELRRDAGERYRVLAVSLAGTDDRLARRVAAECAFPMLLDPEDAAGRLLGLAHPPGSCPLHNLYILDEDGRILFKHHLSAVRPKDFRSTWRRLSGRTPPGRQETPTP